jgi:DNA polymerase-3 subunit gamma/tau
MAYQSLYRRYRPRRFAEVRGQDHLVRVLRNAVREGRVGHAYLLSGPRGTGKTSTARILAKVLNCVAPVDGEPCGECASCLAVDAGTSFDVHELDAASNSGVDAVRELIAKASLGTPGRTKVYILDEVHMLSPAASNALLKTLEEPPDHVVFVLATTDPHKLLPTIRSRTQHLEVHLLPAAELEALVDFVVTDAGLAVSPEARHHAVRAGGGSARDTLSALEQVVAAGGVDDDASALDELVEALCERDTARGLVAIEQAMASGRSPRVLGEHLIARLRDVFLVSLGTALARLSDHERDIVADQAARLGAAGSTRALEVLGDAFVGIRDAPDPRIALEVALVRITRPDADHTVSALADRLARLEQVVASGSPVAESVAGAAPSPPVASVATPEEAERAPSRSAGDSGRRAGPPPPRPGAAGRPADAARTVLADKRSRPGTARRPAEPPSAPVDEAVSSPVADAASAAPAEDPTPDRPPPPGQGAAGGAGAAVASAATALPSRDELTLAWGDEILAGLPQRARVRLAGGRWVDVIDGHAVFGLPNQHHLRRCEEVREEAEAALSAHFGGPVLVRLVIEDDSDGPAAAIPSSARGEASSIDDDEVDPGDLVDAGDVAGSVSDRITELFPGAELVDEP